jgi:hypothetical protein
VNYSPLGFFALGLSFKEGDFPLCLQAPKVNWGINIFCKRLEIYFMRNLLQCNCIETKSQAPGNVSREGLV